MLVISFGKAASLFCLHVIAKRSIHEQVLTKHNSCCAYYNHKGCEISVADGRDSNAACTCQLASQQTSQQFERLIVNHCIGRMNVFEVLPLIVLEVLNEFANNNASSWGYTDLQDKNTVDTKRAYGRDFGC